ncbi:MAG: NAD-dependent DNA ligase LigA, partial [Actinobacteria bacterium]|nr:NAD-dependent DNA ligase LigA [Actinomycetota bacterium]NIS30013.1 NAD-dependent DNA ligase LigA [Actinomycetota bacterium]NIU65284.1 NAD-dependent DNA ligase LigA [Actinomycetota bacterium]NIV86285.1 NAD-dependent DNA ligase LigA [Actinomycetota bacterium]NIW27088.1 NAD-dependent DNA ligase LigA [Actinomycetota bacterium]
LDLFAYELLAADGLELETHAAVLDALADWGFKVNEHTRPIVEIDEAIEMHHDLEDRRDDLDYEIDGIVIKV